MRNDPTFEGPRHCSLSNDLRDMIAAANEKGAPLTPAQEHRYPPPKTGKRFAQQSLANQPHGKRSPVELLPEDGLGQGPLTDLGPSNVTKIFDDGKDHHFATARETVRIACFFWARGLGGNDAYLWLVRVVALLLKGAWEEHAAHEGRWAAHVDHISKVLRAEAAAGTPLPSREPRYQQWAAILDEHGGLVRRHGLTIERLEQLATQMLHAGLHHLPNHGREVSAFAQAAAQEQLCFRDGDAEQQAAMSRSKHDWLQKRDELGGILYENEQLRLDREHVRCDWMAKFGSLHQRVVELAWRCKLLNLELQAIEAGEDLEDVCRKAQEKRDKELAELEETINLAKRRWQPMAVGSRPDPALEVEYQAMVRQALTKLKRLCHDDCLRHHPSFALLTDKQREELARIYREVGTLRLEDLCHAPGTVGYSTPGLDRVTRAIQLAEALLVNAGIDVEVDAIIAGATIGEKIAWLDREVRFLDGCVKDALADHAALLADPNVCGWRNDLATPENDAARCEAFAKRSQELEAEIARLTVLMADTPLTKGTGTDDHPRAPR
jgi:hypothetical protein